MAHTPTPWRWNEKDQLVSTVKVLDSLCDEMIEPVIVETDSGFYPPLEEDREFILRACNAHQELVDTASALLSIVRNCVSDNFLFDLEIALNKAKTIDSKNPNLRRQS